MQSPTYLYHPTEPPILIDAHDVESYLKKGWSDTPATFLGEQKNGQDADETTKEDATEKPRKGRPQRVLIDAND
jgi:hypothetical protein